MEAILVRHDREEVRRCFHPDFVQHNPWADDGGAHVEAMCDFTFGVELKRWAIQGDLVAYHGLYTAPNSLGDHPLLRVDIWRVKAARSWSTDALAPTPPEVAKQMLAGGGDGIADVSGTAVAANASTARRLLKVGVRNRDAPVVRSLLTSAFTLHLPDAADDGVGAFLTWINEAKPEVTIKKSVSSGDLVFLQVLVSSGDSEQLVYDIFRFDQDGKITDLWMVTRTGSRSPRRRTPTPTSDPVLLHPLLHVAAAALPAAAGLAVASHFRPRLREASAIVLYVATVGAVVASIR